jgi:hypothetical protein
MSFGTTDGYNTETNKRLHIDYAKDAFEATNKHDFIEQMNTWLTRGEKLLRLHQCIAWRATQALTPLPAWSPAPSPSSGSLADLTAPRPLPLIRPQSKLIVSIAKAPSAHAVSFANLVSQHSATSFVETLQCYIAQVQNPHARPRKSGYAPLPFLEIDVFHRVKIDAPNPQLDTAKALHNIVHIEPSQTTPKGKKLPAQFDTILVRNSVTPKISSPAGPLGSIEGKLVPF